MALNQAEHSIGPARARARVLSGRAARLAAVCAVALSGCGEGRETGQHAPGRVIFRSGVEELVSLDAGGLAWRESAGAGTAAEAIAEPAEGAAACSVVVITVGEGERCVVGLHITAESLARSLEVASGIEGVDAVVLRFDSAGGRLAEASLLADVVEASRGGGRPIVAWVEDARSSAALVALSCDLIVMAPGGVIGHIVPHMDASVEGVADGAELVAIAGRMVGVVAGRTGRDAAVVGSMVEDGAVFDAERAAAVGLAVGAGSTVAEVAAVIGCEVGVVREVGGRADLVQRDARASADEVVRHAEELAGIVERVAWAEPGAVARPEDVRAAESALGRLGGLVAAAPFLARYHALDEGILDAMRMGVERAAGEAGG